MEKIAEIQIPTIAQLVERRTVELRGYPQVAGSIPACRSFFKCSLIKINLFCLFQQPMSWGHKFILINCFENFFLPSQNFIDYLVLGFDVPDLSFTICQQILFGLQFFLQCHNLLLGIEPLLVEFLMQVTIGFLKMLGILLEISLVMLVLVVFIVNSFEMGSSFNAPPPVPIVLRILSVL